MNQHHRARRQGSARRAATALVTALVLAVGLAGCSGGDGGDDDAGPGGSDASAQDAQVPTSARIGVVTGRLGAARKKAVLTKVTEVVEGWWDAAYSAESSSDDVDAAFGDFTQDARRLARRQLGVMGNADGEDVGEITQKVVKVDVLAPDGVVSGATARFRLLLDEGDSAERITGRLALTPSKQGWKVFAFDVRRGVGG
ncbi:hypothetical protein E9934_01880 [Nocardioides caeni]|uniref:Mce-associated membrane protein n=1 Tax=Nocardioides caeni TaxID=574700 RepID=A0A4S8NN92_9ACTN|nr:hypothetical protein [Nocardioides caeni]THV18403.1 hypothetical protein E9934_01880 [Nocardioides caeni]